MSRIFKTMMVFSLCTMLSAVHAETVEFMSLSDVHLKTSKNKMKINPAKRDDNNNMDQATFNHLMDMIPQTMGNQLKNIKFTVITGDLGGHAGSAKARIEYLKAGFQGVYNKLTATLNLPVFYVFGNNDSTLAHYGPYTPQLSDLALQNNWVNSFLSTGTLCASSPNNYPCLMEENTEKESGGQYTAMLAPNLVLIGVNSTPHMEKAIGHSAKGTSAAMDWFERKMRETKASDNVIIAMHTSPFGSWKKGQHKTTFEKTLAAHPGKVIGILAGHTHFGNVTAYEIKGSGKNWIIPVINTGALATVYGNAPALNHFKVNRKDAQSPWEIQDFTVWSWVQKSANDTLSLRKYYDFDNTYCPGQNQITLAGCLRANMSNGNFKASFKDAVFSRLASGNENFKLPKGTPGSYVPRVIKLTAKP